VIKKLIYTPILVLIPVLCFGFNLSVTASGGNTWSGGVYLVAVGDSISFACEPSSGTGPYTYSWNFDDLETYKNGVSTSQSPSHTFNYLGEHRVWVTVTDTGAGNVTEKALLRIDVRLHDSTSTINVATGCGANNLDNSGASDVRSDLNSCITANYDAAYGLRLYFPAGTYRFDDYSLSTYQTGFSLAWDLLSFVGDGPASTTLSFYNDSDSTTKTHGDLFAANNNTPTKWLFKGMTLQLDYSAKGDTNDDFARRQFLVRNLDDNSKDRKFMLEEVHVKNFTSVVYWGANFIMKRSNITSFGRGDDQTPDSKPYEAAVDYGDNSFIRWTYWADGAIGEDATYELGHSHIFYPQNAQYTYVIENYADMTNSADNKVVGQLKKAMLDSEFSGNLVANTNSGEAIQWGHADYIAQRLVTNDNRFQNIDEDPILFVNTLTAEARRNFFSSSGRPELACYNGVGSCDNDTNCRTDDITITDNEYGFDVSATTFSQTTESCSITNVTETGGSNTSNKYVSSDPSGWYTEGGYVDPDVFEFVAPTNNGDSATDGSGMGASARFPFQEGALAQGHDGSNNYTQVELYADSANLSGSTEIRFADVDHNWSGLETNATFSPTGLSGVTID
jgi:hypothetical protein